MLLPEFRGLCKTDAVKQARFFGPLFSAKYGSMFEARELVKCE